MPISKTYLPDVNVWVAMSFDGHVHNRAAMAWFNNLQEDAIAFCRITQMGFLKLLTNRKVMGDDVLTQAQAWDDYARFRQDSRVAFLNEPIDLEETWRSFTQQAVPASHAWTDAYLLAFAKVRGLTFVSLDQSFKTITDPSVLVLPFS